MLLPSAVAAGRYGAAPALTGSSGTLGFAAWDAAAAALARRWRAAHALPEAPRVALWAGNSPAWAVAAAGVWRLGGALVPLSTRWTRAEAHAALQSLGVHLLVADAGRFEEAESLAEALGAPAAPLPEPAALAREAAPAGPIPHVRPEAPMSYLFTSGTTGRPKAVPITWGQQLAAAVALNRALEVSPADRWDLGLPMFHVGGLSVLMRLWLSGSGATIPERFDAEDLVARAEAGRVSIASLVPQTLARVLDALGDRPWPAAWRAAIVGGAAASPALLARCPAARHSYGLTEACAAITLEPPGGTAPRSAGLPLGEARIRVQDAAGRPLPPGEDGLVAVAGPSVFTGYLGAPEANAARFSAGGFFLTGDWGRLAPDGALTILSRREDLIVSGGENVYPAEVEAAIAEHPAVAEVAVLPREDARWGQVPVAAVVLRASEPLALPELKAFLAPRLARFKHPAELIVLRALPRLPNAKLDRRALAEAIAP